MSPLDDELHDALHTRAASLTPPPDPMAGVEQRAHKMHRRRIALATASAGLAVAVVALSASTFLTSGGSSRLVPAQGGAAAAALDPAHPWSFRGTPVHPATMEGLQHEWSGRHPGSTLTPLFSQLYDPTRQVEVAFVGSGGGSPRYGYAWLGGDAGRDTFAIDQPLPAASTALVYRLPGDEAQRLLVLASPDSRALEFAGDGSNFAAMAEPAGTHGVGVTPFEGTLSAPRVRVLGADGSTVYDEPVVTDQAPPGNVLTSWPQRGSSTHPVNEDALRSDFASAMGRPLAGPQVRYRQLFVGDTGKGEAFTVGQAWFDGEAQAYDVSYTTGVRDAQGNLSSQFFLGKPTPAHPVVLAFDLPNLAGMSDLLVVVPKPGTGQVLYSPTASGAFHPITGQDQRDGVVLIDRSTTASDDQLELLDGDGNQDAPTYKGPVAPLLCGLKECA